MTLNRHGLAMRVGSTPLRIKAGFILAVLVLGIPFSHHLASYLGWTALVTMSVLVHEAGHVIALRRFGFAPTVELGLFGGLTAVEGNGTLDRVRSIAVSLAGPVTGLAFGMVIHAGTVVAGADPTSWFQQANWFVNIWWSLLNLLPVMPLDGGHIAREVFKAAGETRTGTIAAVGAVSIAVVIGIAAVAAHQQGAWIAVAWAALAATNLRYLPLTPRRRRMVELRAAHAQLLRGHIDTAVPQLLAAVRGPDANLVSTGAMTTLAWALLHAHRYDDLASIDLRRVNPNHQHLLSAAVAWYRGDLANAYPWAIEALARGEVPPPANYFSRVFTRLGEMDGLWRSITMLPPHESARAAERVRRTVGALS